MTLAIEAPDRVMQQRLDALEKANAVKAWRTEQLRGMTADRAMALIRDPGDQGETWNVGQIVSRVPKIGRGKRDRLLDAAGVRYTVSLAGLNAGQRVALIALLRYHS